MTAGADLPDKLAEIAEVADRKAALDLALNMGGATLYVPRPDHLGPEHPLSKAVGHESARKIAARFAGDSLYIPSAHRLLARHLYGQGVATADIAAQLGISKSAARRYRR